MLLSLQLPIGSQVCCHSRNPTRATDNRFVTSFHSQRTGFPMEGNLARSFMCGISPKKVPSMVIIVNPMEVRTIPLHINLQLVLFPITHHSQGTTVLKEDRLLPLDQWTYSHPRNPTQPPTARSKKRANCNQSKPSRFETIAEGHSIYCTPWTFA